MLAVLNSASFSNAQRSSDFLRFVVSTMLSGDGEQLKERVLGVEVFHRPSDYSTGEDSVVRVQAMDVRRRLQRFYASEEARDLDVVISLPAGSYRPHFAFRESTENHSAAKSATDGALAAEAANLPEPVAPAAVGSLQSPRSTVRGLHRGLFFAIVAVVLLLCGFVAGREQRDLRWQHSAFEEFWAPMFIPGKPVLLCMPRAATYQLSRGWFDRYHPHQFEEEWQRLNDWPALAPDTPLHASDLWPMMDHGVGVGDTYAAIQLAAAFARSGHSFQARIGQNYTFEDIRSNPSVLVGGFNNRWTIQLSADLPIHFAQLGPWKFALVEAGGAHRSWIMQPLGASGRWIDYALVARLPHSETGQPVVILGGLGRPGTEVLGEFMSDNAALQKMVEHLPSNWREKNVLVVLKTESTDSLAGPAEVVASEVW